MTGDDHPRSWIGVFQTTLFVSLQSSGRSRAAELAVPPGPRDLGRSSAAEANRQRKTRRKAGIIFAIFASYPFIDRQNFQHPFVRINRYAPRLRVELEIERSFAFGELDDFAPGRRADLELDVERHAKDGRRLFL